MKNDFNAAQVADYLGVNLTTARRLMPRITGAYKFALHGLPAPNSPWRVSRAHLDDFINRNKYSVGSAKYEELRAGWNS